MTIITIHSDDGKAPFAAMIGTGAAETCAKRLREISKAAHGTGTMEFVPVGDVRSKDLIYIVEARKRQLQEIGAVPKFPAKAKAKA